VIRRAFQSVLGLAMLMALLSVSPSAFADPGFKRGINIGRMYGSPARDADNPGKFLWPPFRGELSKVSDIELQRLHALGFDFVRLTVAPAPFLEIDEARRAVLLDTLMESVSRIRATGLGVLVDPHPVHGEARWTAESITASTDGDQFLAYKDWLADMAKRLASLDDRKLALGLMNEPQRDCHIQFGTDWTDVQPLLYATVRDIAPDLTVVLTTGCWSGFDGLKYLDMAGFDDNTIVDLHFYSPISFTHQGLPFAGDPMPYMSGVRYPGTGHSAQATLDQSRQLIDLLIAGGRDIPDGAFERLEKRIRAYYEAAPAVDREFIAGHFSGVSDWASSHGVDPGRLLIGEFGTAWPVRGMPDNPDRYVWLEDVRRIAEEAGFGWAFWEYTRGNGYPGFGFVLDNETREIDTRSARALGLDTAPTAQWELRGTVGAIQ